MFIVANDGFRPVNRCDGDDKGVHAELLSRGVDADPEVLRFGEGVPPMFSFRDPDGNTLYVVERM